MTKLIITISVMALLWIIAFIAFKRGNKIINDKTMHVYTTWIIVDYAGLLSFGLLTGPVFWLIFFSLIIGGATGIAATYIKEYIIDQKLGWGQFSKDDIKFSLWGVLIGLICLVPMIDQMFLKQMD